VNNRATELQSVKCADSAGNSLVVSGVITYRVVDAARAVLDMGPALDSYVHVQGQAILKKVCSQYKYISYDGSPSLITEQAHLGDMLRLQLQETVNVCGVAVESFMLSDLAYAKEIAAAMLVRQQAQATIDARKMIVSGAVGIAVDALQELADKGKPISPAESSKFVSSARSSFLEGALHLSHSRAPLFCAQILSWSYAPRNRRLR
jgi:regulator of protease activity HflC (stomatin/prohibitin superfamily)